MSDAASRTEVPPPRNLRQAPERGEVVKTPDLASLAPLAAVASVVALAGGGLCRSMVVALRPFLAAPDTMVLAGQGGVHVLYMAILAAAPPMAAVLAAACAAGVAANLLQTGFMFTPEKLALDPGKLALGAGFKRVFGRDGAMQ